MIAKETIIAYKNGINEVACGISFFNLEKEDCKNLSEICDLALEALNNRQWTPDKSRPVDIGEAIKLEDLSSEQIEILSDENTDVRFMQGDRRITMSTTVNDSAQTHIVKELE